MVSTFSANKHLEEPANGDYPDTWNIPVNQNMTDIDIALGGSTLLNATGIGGGTNITLTSTQYGPLSLLVSGAPIAGGVVYCIPTGVGGQWVFRNDTTGGFPVCLRSNAGGPIVAVPAGTAALLSCDGSASGLRYSSQVGMTAAPGTSNLQLATTAFVAAAVAIPPQSLKRQIYTAGSNTFTPTVTTTYKVTVTGGGGTGGSSTGASDAGGGGGGAGGTAIIWAALAASTGYAAVVGSSGVNSTFNTTVIGGAGGNGTPGVGGTGGTASGGTINVAGGSGTAGGVASTAFAPDPTGGGTGGASFWGGGGAAGAVGLAYGSGGGGHIGSSAGGGGIGAPGIIVIEWIAL